MGRNGRQQMGKDGFTLIEIAIVVVIIGLLLGGVLKGQEMIRSARAHNIADQGNAVKAAILGFTDRYRALPGDYDAATTNIPGISTDGDIGGNGDGNSRIGYNDSNSAGTPEVTNRQAEAGLAWHHLAQGGFISGSFDGESITDEDDWTCSSGTCMTNAFQAPLFLIYDDEQYGDTEASDTSQFNQLWSGKLIPIEIIAELDRKVDDGNPHTGNFRVADGFVGTSPTVGHECATVDGGTGHAGQPGIGTGDGAASSAGTYTEIGNGWAIISQVTDCGAVYLF